MTEATGSAALSVGPHPRVRGVRAAVTNRQACLPTSGLGRMLK